MDRVAGSFYMSRECEHTEGCRAAFARLSLHALTASGNGKMDFTSGKMKQGIIRPATRGLAEIIMIAIAEVQGSQHFNIIYYATSGKRNRRTVLRRISRVFPSNRIHFLLTLSLRHSFQSRESFPAGRRVGVLFPFKYLTTT